MKRVWHTTGKVLVGFFIAAMYAMPQAYTISAKPGVVNYIEGNAYLDGRPITEKALRATFLNANDTLSTDIGKAEVLLSPGVFLRVGDNSAVRMISPSLTDTQFEVTRGEAMVEVDNLVKDNHLDVIDHGGSTTIEKNGLYRFTADAQPTVSVLEGKAEVRVGDKKVDLGKGHEAVIAEQLKAEKFDTKREDELYAWSNVRSEYEAAASYQAAKNVNINNYGGPGWGYGFGGWYGPGWYWDNGFSSWAWLPGDGAFFSPFGFGFYSPWLVGYAPVVVAPVYRGGRWVPGQNGQSGHWAHAAVPARAAAVAIPVNAGRPPAVGSVSASPWANSMARTQAVHSFASSGGFATASGGRVAAGQSAPATFAGASSGGGGRAAYAGSGGGGVRGGGASMGGGGGRAAGGGGHR